MTKFEKSRKILRLIEENFKKLLEISDYFFLESLSLFRIGDFCAFLEIFRVHCLFLGFYYKLSNALMNLHVVQVGILDVDLCGPSIPRMLSVGRPEVHQCDTGWVPVYTDAQKSLALMSIGFLMEDPDEAVVWRGPKKTGTTRSDTGFPISRHILTIY